jgi:predicted nucleic acid-binding protein
MKRQGISVKTMDLIIACYATSHQVPILTADQDFKLMQSAGLEILFIR